MGAAAMLRLVLCALVGIAASKTTSAHRRNAHRSPRSGPELPAGFALCALEPRWASRPLFELHSLTLSPDPPQRNSDLSIAIRGTLRRDLSGGTVAYAVSYAGYSLVREERPLCEVLGQDAGLPQCPLEAGEWSVRHTVRVPWPVPSGTYSLHVAAWDDAGAPLLCTEAEFQIVSPASRHRLFLID